jgi:hypothetical protein
MTNHPNRSKSAESKPEFFVVETLRRDGSIARRFLDVSKLDGPSRWKETAKRAHGFAQRFELLPDTKSTTVYGASRAEVVRLRLMETEK